MNQSQMENPLTTIIFNQHVQIAGAAALVELKLRLLADLIPELEGLAHAKELSLLEDAFMNHYKEKVGDAIGVIKHARQLRNKILHSDFKAAVSEIDTALSGDILRLDRTMDERNRTLSDRKAEPFPVLILLLEWLEK